MLRGAAAYRNSVSVMHAREYRTGIYYIAYVTRLYGIKYLPAPLAGLMPDPRAYAGRLKIFARERRGFYIEAHLIEPAYKRYRLRLILIGNAHDHGSVIF